jgi:hypothetical protein
MIGGLAVPSSITVVAPKRLEGVMVKTMSLEFHMKKLCIVGILLCISATAVLARGGGMGSHHGSFTGGASGTSPAAPGTNSLGTALSSSGTAHPINGPMLGTNPAIDREEAKVTKMIGSICRGC